MNKAARERSDRVMVWGIIGALDAEIAMIRDEMTVERVEESYGLTFYCGSIGSEEVVAVCCSIGTINATVCALTMIQQYKVEAVINVGIAGSSTDELHILDVVIADDLMFHDADLDILEKYYPFRRSFPTDDRLRMLAVQAIQSLPRRTFKWKIGRIVSGDVFVNDTALKNSIIQRCDPLCCEMEGAAIAQVSYMNRIPFLVIRTLSDSADEAADETYDNFLDRAARNSAEILLQMIRLYR